ncbi:hypothetical protein LZ198_19115 [Myxococcus sp. K15C18031901]|uniref:hypothetical protein n=1 Tax=Myxococcus dinghuensis TaxID=2906761 RepID=UPI0020A78A0A|nr:hypothetical protein [Myxococcus dinghuensis]MCP3100988.1 hypothetical protein [Myxococcus dinghuensis]
MKARTSPGAAPTRDAAPGAAEDEENGATVSAARRHARAPAPTRDAAPGLAEDEENGATVSLP